MVQLQMSHMLRQGTQERWRRLYQEVAGSRKEQFERSCQHLEITRMQVMIVHLFPHDLLVMTVETTEPEQTLRTVIHSESPFERWLKGQVESLLGWKIDHLLSDPSPDLIFDWSPSSEANETESWRTLL